MDVFFYGMKIKKNYVKWVKERKKIKLEVKNVKRWKENKVRETKVINWEEMCWLLLKKKMTPLVW